MGLFDKKPPQKRPVVAQGRRPSAPPAFNQPYGQSPVSIVDELPFFDNTPSRGSDSPSCSDNSSDFGSSCSVD